MREIGAEELFATTTHLLVRHHLDPAQRRLGEVCVQHLGHPRDRAAVRAVPRDGLDLVGLAVHGPRNAVDKILKGSHLHP